MLWSFGLYFAAVAQGADASEDGTIHAYPVTPGAVIDASISLQCAGTPLQLEHEAGSDVRAEGPPPRPSSRARFAMDGSISCTLKLSNRSIVMSSLRTVGNDVRVESVGPGAFSFSLPAPGNYYAGFTGLDYFLYIWADPMAGTSPPSGSIIDVSKTVCKPGSGQPCTQALQQLINDTLDGRSNGTTLYFSEGEYLSGALLVQGSGIRFHLDEGAVLRSSKTQSTTLSGFVTIQSASDVNITGRGTLDANGYSGHAVLVLKSTAVHARDVHILGSQNWAVPIRLSQRVTFTNVRLFSGCDGFDPDSSHDVTLDRVFVQSWDDAVAVKATVGKGMSTERILVTHSILSTRKSAMKIGTESLADFRDILFDTIDAFDIDRGAVLYAEDGGSVTNATW